MIIYIYKDRGANTTSANYLKFSLSMALQNYGYNIQFISAEEIKKEKLLSPHVKMFVMGGGSFGEVRKTLGEEGLNNISNYIHGGGRYLGICMGSYAAFSDIEFQGKEHKKSTGLRFFNTTAHGSLPITQPYDGTIKSATIIQAYHLEHEINMPVFYWGGNGMEENQIKEIGATPLVKVTLPDSTEKIMSARINVGDNGGVAFLCGYHPEAHSGAMIWKWATEFSKWTSDVKRLKSEIETHHPQSYLIGLACTLDDMALVEEYSFVQSLYSKQEPTEKHLAGNIRTQENTARPFILN